MSKTETRCPHGRTETSRRDNPCPPGLPACEVRPRGKSPQRPFRVPDDPYYPAVARAKREGRPIGHVVTALLRRYADGELDV